MVRCMYSETGLGVVFSLPLGVSTIPLVFVLHCARRQLSPVVAALCTAPAKPPPLVAPLVSLGHLMNSCVAK